MRSFKRRCTKCNKLYDILIIKETETPRCPECKAKEKYNKNVRKKFDDKRETITEGL